MIEIDNYPEPNDEGGTWSSVEEVSHDGATHKLETVEGEQYYLSAIADDEEIVVTVETEGVNETPEYTKDTKSFTARLVSGKLATGANAVFETVKTHPKASTAVAGTVTLAIGAISVLKRRS